MAAVDRHAEWTSVEKVLDYLTRADAIPHRTEGEGVLLDHLPERVERVLDLGWRCSPASSRPADPDPGGWTADLDRRARRCLRTCCTLASRWPRRWCGPSASMRASRCCCALAGSVTWPSST